jgi:O-antigen/teichoic acid export membrane protein
MTDSNPAPVDSGAGSRDGGAGRRLFRNTLFNGIGGVAAMGLNFVLIAFAIRHLGTASYGVWVLAFSFSVSAGYLSIADLGLQQGIVKFVADAEGAGRRDQINSTVNSAVAVLLALSIAAVAVFLGLAMVAPHIFSVPQSLSSALSVLFIVLGAEAFFGLPALAFIGLLEGLQHYTWIRGIDAARQLVNLILAIVALSLGGGVVGYGVALTVGSILAAGSYAVAAKRFFPSLSLSSRHVSLAALRPLAVFSAWVFVQRISSVVWRQMDKVILAVFLTTSILAGYEVASKIQATSAFALSFTASAIVPTTATLAAKGSTDQLRNLLLRGTRYAAAISLPLTIGAMILARPLIVGWVGPGLADFDRATQLFLAYQLVVSASTIPATMLVGLGRVRAVSTYGIVAAVINLAISIALAPFLGIYGVILGTLVGYGITAPLYIRLVLKELRMSLAEFVSRAILPILPWAIIFATILLLTKQLVNPRSLVLVAATGVPAALIYIFGIAFFAMTAAERRGVVGFVSKRLVVQR